MSRKVGLAAIFLVLITDLASDITQTANTINRGVVAIDTIWNILKATITVIASSLPTYKALSGIPEEKKSTSCQKLGHNRGTTWYSSHSHDTDALNSVGLGIHPKQVPKEMWTNFSLDHSMHATDIV